MRKTLLYLFFLVLTINIWAQQNELKRFNLGFYGKGTMLGKPNVLIDFGEDVIKPTNHFGYEYGPKIGIIINDAFSLSISYGIGMSNINFYLKEDFVESWAKSLYINYTKEDIHNLRREYRPSIISVFYHYNNFSIDVDYNVVKFNSLDINVYGGVALLSFVPSNGINHWIILEGDYPTLYNLPDYSSYSLNSWMIESKKIDLSLNLGITFSQKIYKYHRFNFSFGITYVPRYLLYADYLFYTPKGLNQGSLIQSSSMFNISLSYLINWAAFSHYSSR